MAFQFGAEANWMAEASSRQNAVAWQYNRTLSHKANRHITEKAAHSIFQAIADCKPSAGSTDQTDRPPREYGSLLPRRPAARLLTVFS